MLLGVNHNKIVDIKLTILFQQMLLLHGTVQEYLHHGHLIQSAAYSSAFNSIKYVFIRYLVEKKEPI